MKKILVIAAEFPPMGGPGVQRTAKFVKYLVREGYHPVVVTRKHDMGLKDFSLLQDLEKYTRYDLSGHDWVNGKGLLGRMKYFLSTRLFFPDADVFWYRKHRRKVLEILKSEKIDWVYSTSYPYSDHLMGLFVKANNPLVKWVVDFRDEWTNNPYNQGHWHKKFRLLIERRMEKRVLKACDYLITNTPFMLENFINDTPELADHSTFIPNGFDEEDFQSYQIRNENNKKFKIVYVGSLYGRRIPDYFFEAIAQLKRENTVMTDSMEIEFIGNYHRKKMDLYIEQFDLQEVLIISDYVPHDQLLERVSFANALLLIEREKTFYTGKIFEYLKMGIPILATVPLDGAAASVINRTDTGIVVDAEDIHGIKNAVQKLYKDWKKNGTVYKPNEVAINTYSRKSQAKQLIQCFEKIRRPL